MEEFNISDFGNIDWSIVSAILQNEKFIQNLKNQHGSYTPVYDSEVVLPKEVISQNEEMKQHFITQETMVLKSKYPELSEEYIMKAANLCSKHYSEINASLDRDICIICAIENVEKYKDVYKRALNSFKSNLTNFFRKGNIIYDPLTYSEERVLPLMIGQLNKHLADSNSPLLTWGGARLALSELSKIQIKQEQQERGRKSF